MIAFCLSIKLYKVPRAIFIRITIMEESSLPQLYEEMYNELYTSN